MKTPEGKLKDEVKKYLDSIGAYWFMPVQTGYGRTTLDFLVCWYGLFIAIETKVRGGKVTARQKLTVKEIENSRGYAFVVYSVAELIALMSVVRDRNVLRFKP